MKIKTLLVLLVPLLAAGPSLAADRLMVTVGGSSMHPDDSGYRDIYGGQAFFPEAAAAVRLSGGWFLAAGFGTLTKNGKTPVLGLDAKSTQTFLTGGLGYLAKISGPMRFFLEAGVADVIFKEESMEVSVSGSKVGYQGRMGLMVMGKTLLAGFSLGYLAASGTVEDVEIKMGGPKASVFIGFRI
jgi:hypothetical protein